jgi:hypothetical protein
MALPPIRSARLGEALHWSREGRIDGRTVAVAALGMTAPVGVGLLVGQPEIGFTIGLGAMLLTDAASASGASAGASGGATAQDRPHPASALAPAVLAVCIATVIGGLPWTDAAMIALAGMAAAVSGYSRPVGVAAIRFIVYFVLSFTLLQNAGEHRAGAALIFGLGALWNIAVRLMLRRRAETPTTEAPTTTEAPPARVPTAAQRRAYWRRTLKTLAGWQFPIRIVVGLAAATGLRHLWPTHRYGWIVLTVALLTQRPIEHLPVKTLQRALGTVLGVALTWAILTGVALSGGPSLIVIGGLICLLATAAGVARARNYLAYSVLSTPVILLVLDLGKPVQMSLLTDRLAATAMGAAIVVLANIALDRMVGDGGEGAKKRAPKQKPSPLAGKGSQ